MKRDVDCFDRIETERGRRCWHWLSLCFLFVYVFVGILKGRTQSDQAKCGMAGMMVATMTIRMMEGAPPLVAM